MFVLHYIFYLTMNDCYRASTLVYNTNTSLPPSCAVSTGTTTGSATAQERLDGDQSNETPTTETTTDAEEQHTKKPQKAAHEVLRTTKVNLPPPIMVAIKAPPIYRKIDLATGLLREDKNNNVIPLATKKIAEGPRTPQ